jgi:hypothetical protein
MSRQDGALYLACEFGHVEVVKELIASRADVKAKMNVRYKDAERSS